MEFIPDEAAVASFICTEKSQNNLEIAIVTCFRYSKLSYDPILMSFYSGNDRFCRMNMTNIRFQRNVSRMHINKCFVYSVASIKLPLIRINSFSCSQATMNLIKT